VALWSKKLIVSNYPNVQAHNNRNCLVRSVPLVDLLGPGQDWAAGDSRAHIRGLALPAGVYLLLPFVVLTQRKQSTASLPKSMQRQLIILGVLLAMTQGAIFVALAYLPAVTINLLLSLSNITVALLGIVWLNEHPARFQWVGVVLATLGAVIYFHPVELPQGYLLGIVAAIISILANSGSAIVGREVNRAARINPLVVTTVSMGVGALVLLVVSISTQGFPAITFKGWCIIVLLAVVYTAIAYTLWNYTLQTLSATESNIILGTMLIWIPILAVVFLDEHVSSKELLGLVAAGVGTIIVQLRSPPALLRPLHQRSKGEVHSSLNLHKD
jgi:drug/metabolite transporter (DMT)-like permease